MRGRFLSVILSAVSLPLVAAAVSSQAYTWKNVKIGGGGGFVPNIVFNPTQKGLAYARTDIGGAYRLNADDTWTPLLDFADVNHWNYWGVDALATDPVNTTRVYLATGMYTNSWDPNNGQILISTNYGATWTASPLPFKVGGNMPGRGVGERLAIDPNSNNILFFGARSGNGLWKSTDFGATWSKVSSFTNTGTYVPDPTDTSGYNSDKLGITWVTFDSTSGTSGKATPRIFVGVGNLGSTNVMVSNDAGSTWNAVAGQNSTYIPHKGVLSPATKTLYISYSNGAGPYDGSLGAVMKYNITSGVWTDITPVSGGNLYFGFGGLAIDAQHPNTIMVAALNSWWPDGQIFRSIDGGVTWSPLWSWGVYPAINKFYSYVDTLAPWLGPDNTVTTLGTLQIGWMMEGLSIDPFDSNHWLYGTGATILGGRDLLKWDTTHNVTLESLADGIEETAVTALVSPPVGPPLLSGVGDIEGFVHNSLTVAPATNFLNPSWSTTSDIDYAGNKPTNFVRIGSGTGSQQIALSFDSGTTWSIDYGAPITLSGGKVALSANADTVLWRTGSSGVQVSQYTNAFTVVSSLPSDAQIASDKVNNSVFYGASGSKFYVSVDGGHTFTSPSGLGSSKSPQKIVVNPSVTGDVWVSTDVGIFHSVNSGTTFTQLPGITQAWAIALGAPAKAGGYPAIFAAAVLGTTTGYFRSDDAGVNWVQINDAAHGFAAPGSNPVSGDPRIYGRVYIGTNGRGIFYGDAAGAAPPPSTTAKPTTTSAIPSTTLLSTTSSSAIVKTTTTTSRGTPTTTSPAPTGTGVQGAYGQCGGQGWTGPTVCVSGYKCTYSNPYYSQCIPA
ncbi:Oligoxyloglucan reducing end-specific cellobiohydrolase [Rickenella mellea]|uniref:Oligoxyloglucan reducing end-specific cellobiohydrolase n=1 Tax=Rickenella mellea TaxID=50990 RepID=A0A4Y7QLR4_9AGAM|nr:Oligoxyloglucan reducing end-specific cellobiohydrolase [Rickenella mellea]